MNDISIKIARIIDGEAFSDDTVAIERDLDCLGQVHVWPQRREFALSKADAILALTTTPLAGEARPCTMGVGCDEYGVCYASAHGRPDMCPSSASDPEDAAWQWLETKFTAPTDQDYSADEMVDAFLAGQAAPTPSNIGDAEARELREALEPFVAHWQPWMDLEGYHDNEPLRCHALVTFGDVRRARDALTNPPKATCTPPVGEGK